MFRSNHTKYHFAFIKVMEWSMPESIGFTGIASDRYAKRPNSFHLFYFRKFQSYYHQQI